MKRILIINLGGMGDMLLSAPAVRAIISRYPEAEFVFLTDEAGRPAAEWLFPGCGYFCLSLNISISTIAHTIKVLTALRSLRCNLAVNMRSITSLLGAWKMRMLLDFINPHRSVGRDTDGRGGFFDIGIKEELGADTYEMEYDIAAAGALGARVHARNIALNVERKHNDRIDFFLRGRGAGEDSILIGIHPGGKPSHRWPLENFASLLHALSEERQCSFIITGTQEEAGLGRKLAKMTAARILQGAGLFSLPELAALLQRCSLFVSNDTGPIHLAAFLNVAQIVIFGPGYLKRFDPRNISDKAVVLQDAVRCAPCDRQWCFSKRCLSAIKPERVIEAARGLLGRRVGGSAGPRGDAPDEKRACDECNFRTL